MDVKKLFNVFFYFGRVFFVFNVFFKFLFERFFYIYGGEWVSNKCIAVCKVATPLRELTCHMGSQGVTCHPAEVTFPPLPEPKLVLD